MIDYHLSPGKFSAILDGNTPLSGLSFTLGSAIQWMLSHGVHTFNLQIMKDGSHRSLYLVSESPPKEMLFSPSLRLSFIIERDILPSKCNPPEESECWTIIEGKVYPETTIGDYAFSLSELIVNFFVKGINKAKHQISVAGSLTTFEKGISKIEFNDMNDVGYNPAMKVRELP